MGKRVSRRGWVPLRRRRFGKDVSQRECARRSHDGIWRSLRRPEPAFQCRHTRTVVGRKSFSRPDSGVADAIQLPIFESGGDRESAAGRSGESPVCDGPAKLRRPTSGAARFYPGADISCTGRFCAADGSVSALLAILRGKASRGGPGAERLAQLWPADGRRRPTLSEIRRRGAARICFASAKWGRVLRVLAGFPRLRRQSRRR